MRPRELGSGRIARFTVIGCAIALIISGGVWWAGTLNQGHRVTAYFDAAVGVYPGTEVRVLGMRVGSVSEVVPQGDVVRVDAIVDDEVDLPADARAVAIAPDMVSDRFVQFAPVYAGGPKLADGAIIPRERTASPVELDQLTHNLDKLSTALGPEGANENGALTDLLDTSAENLEGNGEDINKTITQLGEVSGTLAQSRGDLFATVDNLQKFSGALADSDAQIHQLSGQLADANSFLAGERRQLGVTLNELPAALADVHRFVAENRGGIQSNVQHLTGITQALVDQRGALAESLEAGPLAMSNLARTYDPASGTLRTRPNFNEFAQPPLVMVCRLLKQATPQQIPPTLADTCNGLAPLLNSAAPLPSLAEAASAIQGGNLPPLPLNKSQPTSPEPGGGR